MMIYIFLFVCLFMGLWHYNHYNVSRWVKKNAETLRKELDKEATVVLPQVPKGKGRGIVICAGGKYLIHAYASLLTVRKVGCLLPIEIFYAGSEELGKDPQRTRLLFETDIGDVTFIDTTTKDLGIPPTKLRGFEIKSYALLLTSFDDILFLDADCAVLQDPEGLFDNHIVKRFGNLFWPDYPYSDALIHESLGDHFGPPHPPGFETESGQIVLHKNRCVKGLVYAWLLNKHQDIFYKLYYGDKDLFRLGFNMAGLPFSQVPHPPGILGFYHPRYGTILHAMVQKHPDESPLFVHRTQKKATSFKRYIWDVYIPVSRLDNDKNPIILGYNFGMTCGEPYCQERQRPTGRMLEFGRLIEEAESFVEQHLALSI
jgi:alpha 1,2-mannosyltransferase